MLFLSGPEDNITEKLFLPNFKNCKVYRRQTAFFQPSVFKCWGNSISDIVENETKLEIMMAFSSTNKRILDAINGLESKEEKDKLLLKESNSMFEKILGLAAQSDDYKQRIRLIRYLYAKDQLIIKLCVSCDENKENLSLAHNKIGYFLHENNTFTSFMGSMNESESAVMRNGEDLMVFDSSENKDSEGALEIRRKFDAKWANEDPYSIVFSPNRKIIEKVKEISDIKDKEEALEVTKKILDEMGITATENEDKRKLRPHQRKAIEMWDENGRLGILDHATGSGKTFTALKIIEAIRKDIKNLVVLVGVPYIPLADQWLDELDNFFKEKSQKDNFIYNGSIGCYSGEKNWESRLTKELLQSRSSIQSKKDQLSIILTVNKTLSSERFKSVIDKSNINFDRFMFVGDECHRYATKLGIESLPENARYRLGLSATAYDDPSNLTKNELELEEYFKGICHSYSLKQALKDDNLCDYYYKPIACFLDDEEFFEWKEYLDNYNTALNTKSKSQNEHIESMEKVIEGSKEKYKQFKLLIKSIPKDQRPYSIVFCGEKSKEEIRIIDHVQNLLNEDDWSHQTITAEESRQERRAIIKGFQRGDIKSICAMRVLDEGIDIPLIKQAIILASSNKRRQFVQRRGRVLRKSDDKEYAIIHDFIILPPAEYGKAGIRIIEREVNRVEQMGEDALNKIEIDEFVEKYRGLYEVH